MGDVESVMQASLAMADAIARRDVDRVASLLAPDFVHRTPGGEASGIDAFVTAVRQIPGEIAFVNLESVKIDVAGDGALVTGIQHARVRIEGEDIDDRRGFVDWFVKHAGCWKIRVAVDLPAAMETTGSA